MPNFASIAAPLTDLMRKKAPVKVVWGPSQERAFNTLKEIICELPVRFAPDFDIPFTLFTDASDRGMGRSYLKLKRG